MSDYRDEQEIRDRGLTAPRVTFHQIDELMSGVRFETHVVPGTTTTVATAIAANGFTLASEVSACASPENFDEELGRKFAIKKCAEAAKNELWKLEGWRLKHSLEGGQGV